MKDHKFQENIYLSMGFTNRKEYLDSLSVEYGSEMVYSFAECLGATEDFNGLIVQLDDYFYTTRKNRS
jgi:hypothetical protein